VRQTLGWHDKASGRRKERDWLTRSQLKARTGRNSEALALAIDALVKQGYITAQNSVGMLLKTPSDRRNNHGQIYYGISDYWKNQIMSNRKSEQLPALAGAIFQTSGPESKHTTGRKPNTTKETQTKEMQTGNCAETIISQEVASFIEVFQINAQEQGIEPDVTLLPDTQDRLARWLQETGKENQTLILQKFFCRGWISIVQQNYSLRAFANVCNILRTDQ
jgi:hypothetical protein